MQDETVGEHEKTHQSRQWLRWSLKGSSGACRDQMAVGHEGTMLHIGNKHAKLSVLQVQKIGKCRTRQHMEFREHTCCAGDPCASSGAYRVNKSIAMRYAITNSQVCQCELFADAENGQVQDEMSFEDTPVSRCLQ